MEDRWPGLWIQYFRNQAVAVGWPPKSGFKLEGKTRGSSWKRVRKAIQRINVGDHLVVQLKHNRIGRIGEVIGKAIKDNEWNPLVPRSKSHPTGEMGRRILMWWDLINGPLSQDLVVSLPPKARISSGHVRGTISTLSKHEFKRITKAAKDLRNWVAISPHTFSQEKSISDYIGSYPHRLEEGLQPYPSMKIREHVFSDRTRSDVLLIDKRKKPVIVECKQNSPAIADIKQLRRYMKHARRIIGVKARGILVHGGPSKIPFDVRRFSKRKPRIEIVQYSAAINFSESG